MSDEYGRPVDPTDFYGIQEAIARAIDLITMDDDPDPKVLRRLRMAFTAAEPCPRGELPPAVLTTAKVRGCESEVAAQMALEAYGQQCYGAGVAAERERCLTFVRDPALCLIVLRGVTHPADALANAIQSGLPAIRKGETP